MKKFYCLFIAFMIITFIVKSQNTCLNAERYYLATGDADAIPPVGSISPTGPDLGCLLTTQRQLWYYIPVCQDFIVPSINVACNAGMYDSVGIVLYGPFPDKVTNCADLTAGKIIGCLDGPGIGVRTLYLPNPVAQEGNYYYVLLTFSVLIPGNFNFYVDHLGGDINCYECNDRVAVLYKNNLCLVNVDTTINKCVLTWEEFPGVNIAGYKVNREIALSGVYDSVTTIPVGSLSTYTDMGSSPAQHSETYYISAVDSCGDSYPLQLATDALTSIHLITSPGSNNQANLSWNNVYTSSTFVPQYYIYRNSNGSGWQVIDSVGVSLPTITYTDIFAPAGSNQYTVELRKLIPCIAMRTTSNPSQSDFSNTSTAIVTGEESFTDHSFIRIYPNPAKDFVIIYYNEFSPGEVKVDFYSLYGQKLNTILSDETGRGKQEVKLSLEDYPSGIYFVKMIINGKEEVRKIVKM